MRFPVSDAERHYRCVVSAPQEYTAARQGRLPREQHWVSVSPICSQFIEQERKVSGGGEVPTAKGVSTVPGLSANLKLSGSHGGISPLKSRSF